MAKVTIDWHPGNRVYFVKAGNSRFEAKTVAELTKQLEALKLGWRLTLAAQKQSTLSNKFI